MERILSVAEMKEADEFTIKTTGVSAEILTERAGTAVAEEITKRFKGGRVLVCMGKGNNGKDGKVIASVLSKIHGFSVSTFSAEVGFFKIFEKKFDIIVDCLFGTGLNKEITGRYKTAVEKINESGAFVVSCDIPSGINGDNGRIMGVAVKANLTVAVQEFKLGHFLNEGIDYSGKVIARDIGISVWTETCAHRITDKDAATLFPERPRNMNKGNAAKIAVVGGSKQYSGSVMLSYAALCAYKTGAGYAAIAVPECIFGIVAGINPECIIHALPSDGEKIIFNSKALKPLLEYDSIAFGMGATATEDAYKTLVFIIENYKGRLLIDADGINVLSVFGKDILKSENRKCEIVITPHIGEFCRISGKEKNDVLNSPISAAVEFATEYNVTVLLKNSVSVITDGKTTVINTTGDSGMAKGGSGDVLSGFAAGLLSRNEEPFFCVAVAAYLFGKAGEAAAKEQNSYSMTATDIISNLPKAINSVI
ncbi:MAG: NAD(P)H-hydrate dehydratase [Clostridia bacterium]|nr:NAD(P)H-hydrate dehydratase [Clostridia bacterium]